MIKNVKVGLLKFYTGMTLFLLGLDALGVCTQNVHAHTHKTNNVCYSEVLDPFYFLLQCVPFHVVRESGQVCETAIYSSTRFTKHALINNDIPDSLFPQVAFNPIKIVWDFSVHF